jgi:hypothetical protein
MLALPFQLQLQQGPASLALPSIVGERRVALIDLPSVMLDVDGALAEGAGYHEVFVD